MMPLADMGFVGTSQAKLWRDAISIDTSPDKGYTDDRHKEGRSMKIEVERKNELKGIAAYIDRDGDLIIKSSSADLGVIIVADGYGSEWAWNPEKEAAELLYPGDKVTITF